MKFLSEDESLFRRVRNSHRMFLDDQQIRIKRLKSKKKNWRRHKKKKDRAEKELTKLRIKKQFFEDFVSEKGSRLNEDIRPAELRENIFLESRQWSQFFYPFREEVSLSFEVKIEGAELGSFANELFTQNAKPKFKSNKDFTAPENLLGQKFSRKSDIWSVGCILYEILNKKKLINTKKDSKFRLRFAKADATRAKRTEFLWPDNPKLVRKVQQALVIHSKVGKIPDYFWKNKRVQEFWEHPMRELVKSDKMVRDILEGFPRERVRRGSTLRESVKEELFRDPTVGMFVETMNYFDRIFYKRIWEADG